MARPGPFEARKLPTPTRGLRAKSGIRASLDPVLSQGKPTPGLGPCNLSVLSFICVQGSVFICFHS